MKWCMISKDEVSTISVNRMKNTSKISNKEDVLKFIHKKNTNKGKIQSITIKGPYNKDNEVYKWIICYLQPLNKSHINSEWELICPDGKFKVYNSAILIHTLVKEHNYEYPNILDTKDIDENDCLEWKESTSVDIDYKNEPDEPDEDLSDVDARNDNDSVDNYNNEPDEPDEPDYDDDVFEVPKTTDINTQHSVELNNDLLTNTSNLEYEKYDYESCIIPVM